VRATPLASHDASARLLADLEARVFARPDDEALRQVVADALMEAGDPRGEFIALQLFLARGPSTPEQRARALALEREHGARWSTVRGAEQVEHQRGFPWLVRTRQLNPGKAWATVGVLVVLGPQPVGKFLTSCDALRSLERLTNVGASELVDCARWKTPRLTSLDLEGALTATEALPLVHLQALRELSLSATGPSEVGWLATHPLAERLDLVRLRVPFGAEAFDLRPSSTPRVRFLTQLECFLGFSVEVKDDTLVVRLVSKAQLEAVAQALEPTLRLNVPKVIKRLHLVATDGVVAGGELPPLLKRFARHLVAKR
jgi:uncharacterized protein (TIGR02996 family)